MATNQLTLDFKKALQWEDVERYTKACDAVRRYDTLVQQPFENRALKLDLPTIYEGNNVHIGVNTTTSTRNVTPKDIMTSLDAHIQDLQLRHSLGTRTDDVKLFDDVLAIRAGYVYDMMMQWDAQPSQQVTHKKVAYQGDGVDAMAQTQLFHLQNPAMLRKLHTHNLSNPQVAGMYVAWKEKRKDLQKRVISPTLKDMKAQGRRVAGTTTLEHITFPKACVQVSTVARDEPQYNLAQAHMLQYLLDCQENREQAGTFLNDARKQPSQYIAFDALTKEIASALGHTQTRFRTNAQVIYSPTTPLSEL